MSHDRSMYPLSPRMRPSSQGLFPSKSGKRSVCLRMQASCTEPGHHLAMTLMKIKSTSQITTIFELVILNRRCFRMIFY